MEDRRTKLTMPPGFLLALPWLIGTATFVALPLLVAGILSMTQWNGVAIGDAQWLGGGHYQELILEDKQFHHSVHNTLIFAGLATPLSVSFALALAILLNVRMRGIYLFRAIIYLPHVLGGVATILVWSWVFNPSFGPVNVAISWAHEWLDPIVRLFNGVGTDNWATPGWLASEFWCKPAVVVIHIWSASASVFVFLAALQNADPDTRAAALLDGANLWRKFLHITLPQVTPAILFNLITGFVAAMQSFNYSYLLFNRAQNDGLLFVVLQIYRSAFEPPYRFGYASAMASLLFIFLLGFSMLAVRTSKRWVHYES